MNSSARQIGHYLALLSIYNLVDLKVGAKVGIFPSSSELF